ncbi:MAG: GNAT family N-acetyltransferase [Nisaea sp.]|uniref:GNAT family N-acetyltransferase n=1 Tax=Nisaea sp. TaxID=2024842 RepID=UPI001B031B7E|nr:GNAT family N-acetyltransferase [Nisaea sp.]MBO6560800.1 GNAT family N-acetyltransferase [Nisaea sp.]
MPDPRDIKIRPAEAKDASAVGKVQVETWQDAYVGILPDRVLLEMRAVRSAAQWSNAIAKNSVPGFFQIAEWQGRIVGFCQGGPRRQDIKAAGNEVGEIAEIYVLYVDPSFQGLGVGTAMMGRVVDSLAGEGFGSLLLTVLSANRSGVAFYEKLDGSADLPMECTVMGVTAEETVYRWPDIRALQDRLAGAVG